MPQPGTPTGGGPKSTVAFGQIVTESGPLGYLSKGARQTVQAWAKYINAQGGLSGHPVRIVVADDGGNPSSALAIMKQMVEKEKVIAFIANFDVTSQNGWVPYVNERKIPVIGICMCDGGLEWGSPYVFPQGGFVDDWSVLVVKLAAEAAGSNKFGLLYCAEIKACENTYANFAGGGAKRAGADMVYSAKISVAGVDYTNNCLDAFNAGVKVMMVNTDAATVNRVATSCARQNFKFQYVSIGLGLSETQESFPPLEGMMGTLATAPWMVTSTPATAELHNIMKQYAPGVTMNSVIVAAWNAAKLTQAASAQLPDNPTSQDVLEGLWRLRNETLGGLTGPLNFPREKPPQKTACGSLVKMVSGKWSAPTAATTYCYSADKGWHTT
jgi:branched-chain amino acid transport system substrate-binding protein